MKFIFGGGIVFFIGSLILIRSQYDDLEVERKGIIVQMRIEKLPNSCLGTKVKHFAKLSYQGETYIKRIGGQFCDDHNVGQLVDVKFLEGSSTVLFPDETVTSNLLAFAALGLVGVVIASTQWKKIRK